MKSRKYKKKLILTKDILLIAMIGSFLFPLLLTEYVSFINKNNFNVAKIFGIHLGFYALFCIISLIIFKIDNKYIGRTLYNESKYCYWINVMCSFSAFSFFGITFSIMLLHHKLHLDNQVIHFIIGISIITFIVALINIIDIVGNFIQNAPTTYPPSYSHKSRKLLIASIFIPPIALISSMCVTVFCKSSLIAGASGTFAAFIIPFFILCFASSIAEDSICNKNGRLNKERVQTICCTTVLCSVIGIMTSASLHEKGIMTSTAFTSIVIALSVIGIGAAAFIAIKHSLFKLIDNIDTRKFYEEIEVDQASETTISFQ